MALIRVDRYKFNKDNTISRMYVDDELFCFGIEDEKRNVKVKGETCIPDGVYELGTRWSPKFSSTFNHDMIWVKNVPNFDFILLHWGNTDDDTDGCYIIGDQLGIVKGQEAVLNSRATYKRLYAKVINRIKAGGEQIEYRSLTVV